MKLKGLLIVLLFAGSIAAASGQPKLVLKTTESYQVGDRVSEEIFILNKDMKKIPLLKLIKPDTRVVVLIFFGGGMKSRPDRTEFRGTLWCEDSFDDLSVQRALFHTFKDSAVQFVPVAVPPVYRPTSYGWEESDFLGSSEDSDTYLDAARSFIEATEREVASGLIPFPEVYYDPKFRLAQNRGERDLGPEYGTVYDWQGKLKWHQDARRYGAPTIWFLSGDGTVLAEPFFGNDYDSDPPEIYYGFAEGRDLIENLLK
jgi:hypothetical protein